MPVAGAEAITRALVGADVYPTELRSDEASLEEVFLRLTGDDEEGEL
jgi:hypothetical protein